MGRPWRWPAPWRPGIAGISTVHAESAEGTLSRLEGLILEVSTNPQRELLGSVIDLIVHMERAGRQFRCTEDPRRTGL